MTKEELLSSPVTSLRCHLVRAKRGNEAIITAYPNATIRDLVNMGKKDLLKTPNVGDGWFCEFDKLVNKFGIVWQNEPEPTPENSQSDTTLEQFIQMALQQFREGITGISMELDSPYGLDCTLKIEIKQKA